MHVFNWMDLEWRKNSLWLTWGDQHKPLAMIVPDPSYPQLWRIRLAGSVELSDMVNRSRAKDAAELMALRKLNAANFSP